MKRILILASATVAVCLVSTVTLVRAQTQVEHPKLDAKACV